MAEDIDMSISAVRSLGDKSHGVVDLVKPAAASLSDGWSPGSDPAFKSTLELCRQKWISTFTDLREASGTIGDKLHASARAVESGDTDSADQF